MKDSIREEEQGTVETDDSEAKRGYSEDQGPPKKERI